MPDSEIQVPELADSDRHIEVPDSLPAPPADLMRKIDANMADGRVLIIATANYGMRDYMYNWIESLKRTNETKFLVFCLDDKLYEHLVSAGYGEHATTIPDEWFHQAVASEFEDYWSPLYKAITHSKTLVVQRLLYLDINVFFSDIDIVWLRPRMREYLKALLDIRQDTHVIFQQEGLDERQINSGFFMMRPALDMKRLLAETIVLQDSNQGLTQQGAMNRALNSIIKDIRTSSVILLDVMHFPNGFAYFDHNLSNSRGVQPYILHANYRVAGRKKEELQMRGYWYVDEEWIKEIDEVVESTWNDSLTTSAPS
ncbi:nucleotide-diphospho-sugar transferase-domain-containing protein [Dichotomocladium elegans]|nr:nucleotide-diphospho-sugar transferase-domain-containing protein [Dichotomocladium elegans]